MRYILVANGSIMHGPAVDAVLAAYHDEPTAVIGVDGGSNYLALLHLTPSLIVGDLDSIYPETLQRYQSIGVEIHAYPPAKDETDLELALFEAASRDAHWIRILAASGERLDQTIANIYLLGIPQLDHIDARIVSGKQNLWLMNAGEHKLTGEIGDTISLIPFAGDAEGITTYGLEYPLKNESLRQGPARGVSNVIVDTDATVSLKSGKLLVVHTIGKA